MRTPSFLRHLLHRSEPQDAASRSLSTLPELILEAGKLARLLHQGRHSSRRSGPGEDFWQFRPHMPHEPASNVDWKQSARSPNPETLWVRERERQNPHQLLLWVDPSASMQWRSSQNLPYKKETALTDALALGQAALEGGERVGVLGGARHYSGSQHLPRLAHDLTHQPDSVPDLRHVSPHAQIVLVSDFLWSDEILEPFLDQCRHRHGKTFFLGVLDPQERDLAYWGHLRFTSPEGDTPLTLPAVESLQTAYQNAMEQHFQRLTPSNPAGQSSFEGSSSLMVHLTDGPAWPVLMRLHRLLGGRV